MDFVKKFKIMACVSAAIMIVGLAVGIFAGGLNVGVDFTGGTLFTMDMKGDYDMNVITNALRINGLSDAQAVRTGASTSSQTMVDVRMKSKNDDAAESEARVAVLETVQATYPDAEITAVDRVDGVASKDLVRNAILSIVIASALILLYIWIRFELYSGVAAVLALLHDVAIMLALTCVLRIPINSPFIAAVLTIVGYSINNTIIVFDRIRENGKSDVAIDKHRVEIVNKSIKQTITRSINTSVTTLATIIMLYVMGVESIRQFALPIIIGLLAGTYSSIFLAGPLWANWYLHRADKQRSLKKKASKAKK